MGYFDNILSHIEEASLYTAYGQCQLFAGSGPRRRIQAEGIGPFWIRSRPDIKDGFFGFYVYAEDQEEPAFVLFNGVSNGNSEQDVFFRTVPGALDALQALFHQAQREKVIELDYATTEMTVYSLLLPETDLPTRMAVLANTVTDSEKYEIHFFDEGRYDQARIMVVGPEDTKESFNEFLLSLNIAGEESSEVETQFLEEIAVIIQQVQEKYTE